MRIEIDDPTRDDVLLDEHLRSMHALTGRERARYDPFAAYVPDPNSVFMSMLL